MEKPMQRLSRILHKVHCENIGLLSSHGRAPEDLQSFEELMAAVKLAAVSGASTLQFTPTVEQAPPKPPDDGAHAQRTLAPHQF